MNSIALKMQQRWELTSETVAFINWLFVWVFLINFAFMLMWTVGAPPRYYEIAVVGLVGLLVRRMPYPIQAVAFLASMGACILTFIGGLFNLSFLSLVHSLQFFAELNPFGSISYILMAVVLVLLSVFALITLKSKTYFASPILFVAALAIIISISAFDYYLSIGNRGHYKRDALQELFSSPQYHNPVLPLMQMANGIFCSLWSNLWVFRLTILKWIGWFLRLTIKRL